MKAEIFDIKRYAVHDGPGIRTTFFLKGCPLRCLWCQNPESMHRGQDILFTRIKCIGCGACLEACGKLDQTLRLPRELCTQCGSCVAACKTGARHFAAKLLSPEETAALALEDQIFYDLSGGGVTFSGGECLMHADFMEHTLRLCKESGLHTTVDTCGFVPFETFERILPFTDLFLYDIKILDPMRHKEYTGRSNELILSNVKALALKGASLIIRVPLIPGCTDSPKNMEALGDFILEELDNRILRVELLQYNRLAASKYGNTTIYTDGGPGECPLPDSEPQTKEYISYLSSILEEKGICVFCETL